jgi:D-alanyl-D-alanine carboxypeptidase
MKFSRNTPSSVMTSRLAFLGPLAIIFFLPIALCTNGVARADQHEFLDILQSRLNELYASSKIPGVTASIVLEDGTAIEVAAGFADLKHRIRLQPQDHMLSGSMGKTYVSAVMLELVSENRAQLDDKLQTFLGAEGWYLRLPNARDISLRSLLNHTSGIPNHVYDKKFIAEVRKTPGRNWTPEEIVSYVLDRPPVGSVGQKYVYSDTNYILIGMVIEKITENVYYDELEKRILRPFQLNDTRPSNRRIIPELVNGYTQPGDIFGLPTKVCEDGKDALNPQIEWTGGGLVSNSRDIARWAHLLYGGQVLAPKSLGQMLSDTTAASEAAIGPGVRYGLGVYEWNTELGIAYGHQGDFPGYWSVMEYFPEYKVAVGMQFNTDDSTVLGKKPLEFAAEMVKVVLVEPHLTKP